MSVLIRDGGCLGCSGSPRGHDTTGQVAAGNQLGIIMGIRDRGICDRGGICHAGIRDDVSSAACPSPVRRRRLGSGSSIKQTISCLLGEPIGETELRFGLPNRAMPVCPGARQMKRHVRQDPPACVSLSLSPIRVPIVRRKCCNPSLVSPNGALVNLSNTERLRSPAGRLDTMGLPCSSNPSWSRSYLPSIPAGVQSASNPSGSASVLHDNRNRNR